MTSAEKFKTVKLFKRDRTGNVREFWWEVIGGEYRSMTGVVGGTLMVGEWKRARSTNVGQTNERDSHEQAVFMVTSDHDRRLERGGYTYDSSGECTTFHFKPMLAEKYNPKKPPSGRLFSQPKLDGIRCVARADGLWTRNGKQIHSCPHVESVLAPFFEKHPDAVLDGELYNHDLKNDFEKITSLVRRSNLTAFDYADTAELVQYHVYDAPVIEDGNADADFIVRYDFAMRELSDVDGRVIRMVDTSFTDHTDTTDTLYSEYLEAGYEGQMIRKDESYDNFRTGKLLKRKEFVDAEFEIVRIEEGVGAWSGAAKRVIMTRDGVEFAAGIRGTYQTNAVRLREKDEYVGGVATTRFQNYTGTSRAVPRFGVVVDLVKRGEDRA